NRVAQAIDALSLDSDHVTKTQSEQAFNVAFISQLADIGLIVGAIMGAVFFTLILLTGNTMAQAVRERIPELAVLKTIGFANHSVLALVLAEAAALLLIGAVIGLVLAGLVVSAVRLKFGTSIPLDPVGGPIWLRGLLLALLVGLIVGALPARRGMRLRIVDALSGR
ncbi:MAG TPA: FtsX-like permease family protein, partial [Steroidobacteraceae bacterium]|nr:FtsX-like permease family protein [Steroidobacteraceae bacterium]